MSEEGKPGDVRGTEVIRASSHFLGHGMTFAALVALFGWIGFEVGTRIGAESLLLILGILLGGAVGSYSLYLQVVVRPREDQGREEGEEK